MINMLSHFCQHKELKSCPCICLDARINEVNVYSTYKHSIQVSTQEETWFWLIEWTNQRMVTQIKMDPCFFSTFEQLQIWQTSVCD